MHIESYRDYCLRQKGATESFPFSPDTIVYKVAGKIFTLANIAPFDRINLKCDPQKAIHLRQTYPCVLPGYHMNKKHWNTILINQQLSDLQIYQLIDHSYQLVLAQLPRHTLQNLLKNKN